MDLLSRYIVCTLMVINFTTWLPNSWIIVYTVHITNVYSRTHERPWRQTATIIQVPVKFQEAVDSTWIDRTWYCFKWIATANIRQCYRLWKSVIITKLLRCTIYSNITNWRRWAIVIVSRGPNAITRNWNLWSLRDNESSIKNSRTQPEIKHRFRFDVCIESLSPKTLL